MTANYLLSTCEANYLNSTAVKAIMTVYSENCTKRRNTLCRWNAEFLNVRTGYKCSYHRALNGQPWR